MDYNYYYTLRDLKVRLEIETIDLKPKHNESMLDSSFVGIIVDQATLTQP